MSDEMSVAFGEQLNTDLADKAAAQQTFTWDEGYYLAQYSKHTIFKSDIQEFTRKDGSGTFANKLYDVPVGMFVFNLLGRTARESDPIEEFEAPKGFAFKATFQTVVNDKGKLVPESVNGGLLTKAALSNGAGVTTTSELLEWLANNMVVIHIGLNKSWVTSAGKVMPASNVIRSVKPYSCKA
jgi:hypothetical protein